MAACQGDASPVAGRWELAPAFDITHAYRPYSEWTSRHLMSVNGKFDDITVTDFHAVGNRHEVPGFREIIREVRAAVDGWEGFAASSGLDPVATKEIELDIERFRPS
jgi:serine/threonine-protein kinase HipA